ncbi:hypothetical protein N6H18_08615 [Reichenbachiella agarivorans]|uniref:Four helix bundle sensory module for signal transduction n=1 Tax=Reichenbachiella agarivorans TaxID=2979464 RepID=A0ABY6CU13_9BACT|nr:hypothetical protein [Reichenbachiella agarivorans]UXP34006.1 hypothetical protein N6H18_08615 [Reichenbachiella agarivorans]
MRTYSFFPAVIVIGLSFLALFLYDLNHHSDLTIERATSPIQHLANARQAILDRKFNTSIREMDAAIMDMKIIELSADSTATKFIERAIQDLKFVETEIQNDSISLQDLNHAYFNALNSIAYANLIISEKNLDKGERYEAMRFMNATIKEMVSSLNFAANERDKEREKVVIDDIKDILSKMKDSEYEYRFNYDSINKEVQEMIEISN